MAPSKNFSMLSFSRSITDRVYENGMAVIAQFSDKMGLLNIVTESFWSGQGFFDKIGFYPLMGPHYSLHYSPEKGMIFTSNEQSLSPYSFCNFNAKNEK